MPHDVLQLEPDTGRSESEHAAAKPTPVPAASAAAAERDGGHPAATPPPAPAPPRGSLGRLAIPLLGIGNGNSLRRMLIHAVDAEDFMRELSVTSKLNADWEFLCHLRDVGRAAAGKWLAAHFDAVGTESTIDIREKYL